MESARRLGLFKSYHRTPMALHHRLATPFKFKKWNKLVIHSIRHYLVTARNSVPLVVVVVVVVVLAVVICCRG